MTKYRTLSLALLLVLLFIGLSAIVSQVFAGNPGKQMVVVIDPGHGGKDPGAVNNGVREKDIVLGVGLKLGKLISENFSDVKIIYTRSTDVFIPLIDRSRIANKNKADLFISIHANTCGTPSTRGTETFTLGLHRTNENLDVAKKENSVILLEDNYTQTYEGFDPNSSESYIMFELTQDIYLDQSLSFADDIQRQFHSKNVSINRGVKQAGFLVLRQSSMPSVLIETGFVSNPSEARYLNSDDGQQTIASSIFDAFKKFKSRNSGLAVASGKKEKTQETPKSKTTETQPKEVIAASLNDSDKTATAATQEPKKENIKENAPKQTEPEAKTEKPKNEPTTTGNVENTDSFYCVQIGANTTAVEPTSANFKGLKNVRRDKLDKYYRYYVGKENTLENAVSLLNQVKVKFPQAFVVYFSDGKRNIINLENK